MVESPKMSLLLGSVRKSRKLDRRRLCHTLPLQKRPRLGLRRNGCASRHVLGMSKNLAGLKNFDLRVIVTSRRLPLVWSPATAPSRKCLLGPTLRHFRIDSCLAASIRSENFPVANPADTGVRLTILTIDVLRQFLDEEKCRRIVTAQVILRFEFGKSNMNSTVFASMRERGRFGLPDREAKGDLSSYVGSSAGSATRQLVPTGLASKAASDMIMRLFRLCPSTCRSPSPLRI